MNKIIKYTLGVYITSFAFGFLVLNRFSEVKDFTTLIYGFIPAVFAVVFALREGGLKRLGLKKMKWIDVIHAIKWPVIYTSLMYTILFLTGLITLNDLPIKALLPVAFLGSMVSIPLYLGEELGWRGYLEKKLIGRFGYDKGVILLGLIWGLWHLPMALEGYSLVGMPVFEAFIYYPIGCIGLSYMMHYVNHRSGSVWSSTIFHSFNNNISGTILLTSLRHNIVLEAMITMILITCFALIARSFYLKKNML